MTFKFMQHLVVSTMALLSLPASARATPEKDAAWNNLIAEAVKHGGVETISGKSGSYVFSGPKGLSVTFTRKLDNTVRLVCAGYLSANINVCMNWDSEKMLYSTRENEGAPWVVSNVPPDAPQSEPETPLWLNLLSAFLDVDVPYSTFHRWHHDGGPSFAKSGFISAFHHGFTGGGKHR